MREKVLFQVTRRGAWWAVAIAIAFAAMMMVAQPLRAQRVQESFRDKFNIAEESGGVAVATSSDGQFVYVAGRDGVIVSNDHGKTGTWVQTVRMK